MKPSDLDPIIHAPKRLAILATLRGGTVVEFQYLKTELDLSERPFKVTSQEGKKFTADCLVIAIVAAAMSSMDSVLLVAGSVLYKDLLEPFDRRGRSLQWTRIGIIGVAVLAAVQGVAVADHRQ